MDKKLQEERLNKLNCGCAATAFGLGFLTFMFKDAVIPLYCLAGAVMGRSEAYILRPPQREIRPLVRSAPPPLRME